MKVPAALVSSVVEKTLECREGGEIVELLRSFVYLRPLERETFLRVSRHAQEVLVKDDDHGHFSDGIHALVRSLAKFTGRGGDVFSQIEDGTLKTIASKLKQREVFNSPVSHFNLRFSVVIYCNKHSISSQFEFQSSILRCSK